MANEYIDDDAKFEDAPDWAKDLRKAYKEQAKELKAARDHAAELEGKVRTTTVADVLKQRGVRPGIAKYVQVDGDVTTEAVDAWLKENAEDFGLTLKAPEGAGTQPPVVDGKVLGQNGLLQADPFGEANLASGAGDAEPATAFAKWQEELLALDGTDAVNAFMAKGYPGIS